LWPQYDIVVLNSVRLELDRHQPHDTLTSARRLRTVASANVAFQMSMRHGDKVDMLTPILLPNRAASWVPPSHNLSCTQPAGPSKEAR
jgi:hypothetical protein